MSQFSDILSRLSGPAWTDARITLADMYKRMRHIPQGMNVLPFNDKWGSMFEGWLETLDHDKAQKAFKTNRTYPLRRLMMTSRERAREDLVNSLGGGSLGSSAADLVTSKMGDDAFNEARRSDKVRRQRELAYAFGGGRKGANRARFIIDREGAEAFAEAIKGPLEKKYDDLVEKFGGGKNGQYRAGLYLDHNRLIKSNKKKRAGERAFMYAMADDYDRTVHDYKNQFGGGSEGRAKADAKIIQEITESSRLMKLINKWSKPTSRTLFNINKVFTKATKLPVVGHAVMFAMAQPELAALAGIAATAKFAKSVSGERRKYDILGDMYGGIMSGSAGASYSAGMSPEEAMKSASKRAAISTMQRYGDMDAYNRYTNVARYTQGATKEFAALYNPNLSESQRRDAEYAFLKALPADRRNVVLGRLGISEKEYQAMGNAHKFDQDLSLSERIDKRKAEVEEMYKKGEISWMTYYLGGAGYGSAWAKELGFNITGSTQDYDIAKENGRNGRAMEKWKRLRQTEEGRQLLQESGLYQMPGGGGDMSSWTDKILDMKVAAQSADDYQSGGTTNNQNISITVESMNVEARDAQDAVSFAKSINHAAGDQANLATLSTIDTGVR